MLPPKVKRPTLRLRSGQGVCPTGCATKGFLRLRSGQALLTPVSQAATPALRMTRAKRDWRARGVMSPAVAGSRSPLMRTARLRARLTQIAPCGLLGRRPPGATYSKADPKSRNQVGEFIHRLKAAASTEVKRPPVRRRAGWRAGSGHPLWEPAFAFEHCVSPVNVHPMSLGRKLLIFMPVRRILVARKLLSHV